MIVHRPFFLVLALSIGAAAVESPAGATSTGSTSTGSTSTGSTSTGSTSTAVISTAAIRRGQLSRPLTLYGTVVPATGSTYTITLACDAVIDRWLLPVGAPLPGNTVLGEAHLTAEAAALRSEAFANETVAQEDLRLLRARLELKLATQAELVQAESAAHIATVRATAWRTRCPDERITFVTPVAGTLLATTVTQGQIVSAGTPLAVVATGAQEARLGIEPDDAQALASGTPFTVVVSRQPDVHLAPSAASMISALIDPDTRLLTVLVPIGQGQVAFGSGLSATVERQGPVGLLVPRAALVSSDAGWCVFTISDSVAHVVAVTITAEYGAEAVIAGERLAPEQLVAVHGSSVLSDGMRVQVADDEPEKPGSEKSVSENTATEKEQ